MEWNKCISEQIAGFYGVPNEGHRNCCGFSKDDPRIEKLKEKLAQDTDIVINDDETSSETEVEFDTIDEILVEKIKRLLNKEGSDEYFNNWKDVLKEDYCTSTQYLLLNIDPKYIVLWNDSISPYLCEECLMTKHNDVYCRQISKAIGSLIYEYLAIKNIISSEKKCQDMNQ